MKLFSFSDKLAVGSTKIPATLCGYQIRPGIESGTGQSATDGSDSSIQDPTRTDPNLSCDTYKTLRA